LTLKTCSRYACLTTTPSPQKSAHSALKVGEAGGPLGGSNLCILRPAMRAPAKIFARAN
jgi:hypothetical protein